MTTTTTLIAAFADDAITRRLARALPGARRVDPADRAALATATAVIEHLSGAPARIEAGSRALQAALPPGARLVQLGSQTVYGAGEGTVDEQAPLSAALGAYAAARLAADALAAARPGAVRLRLGVEYGCGDPTWGGRVARWLLDGRLGDLGSAGEGICNLLHLDDLAAAVVAALDSPAAAGRAFNLALPQAPSWNGFFAAYGAALGIAAPKRIGAARLALEAYGRAPLAKLAEKAGLHGAPPIPPSALRAFRLRLRLDVRAAEQVLGLRWTRLAEGLAEAAATSAASRRPAAGG